MTTDDNTRIQARWVLLSVIPYILLTITEMITYHDVLSEIASKQDPFVISVFVYALLLGFAYLFYVMKHSHILDRRVTLARNKRFLQQVFLSPLLLSPSLLSPSPLFYLPSPPFLPSSSLPFYPFISFPPVPPLSLSPSSLLTLPSFLFSPYPLLSPPSFLFFSSASFPPSSPLLPSYLRFCFLCILLLLCLSLLFLLSPPSFLSFSSAS